MNYTFKIWATEGAQILKPLNGSALILGPLKMAAWNISKGVATNRMWPNQPYFCLNLHKVKCFRQKHHLNYSCHNFFGFLLQANYHVYSARYEKHERVQKGGLREREDMDRCAHLYPHTCLCVCSSVWLVLGVSCGLRWGIKVWGCVRERV